MIRRHLGAVVTAVLLASALAVIGVEGWFAVAWGVAAGVLVAVGRALVDDDEPPWPPRRPDARQQTSALSGLAWGFNPATGEAGPMVMARIRRLAGRRLARLGLDLDDDAAASAVDALLGPGAAAHLATRRLPMAHAASLMTGLERLAAQPPTVPDPQQEPHP